MKFKSFFLRNHMKFYGIICLVANVLAVFSSGISSFVMLDTEACAVQQEFIASHPFLLKDLGSVVAYGLPVLLCVLYGVKRYGMELKGYTDFAFALILLSLGLVLLVSQNTAALLGGSLVLVDEADIRGRKEKVCLYADD